MKFSALTAEQVGATDGPRRALYVVKDGLRGPPLTWIVRRFNSANPMSDRSTQLVEERQPQGRGLLYVGVVLAVPALVYLATVMTASSRDQAADPPDALMPFVLPFVYASPLLALVCFGVAIFAFVRFRRSRVKHVTGAAVVWLCDAAAYAYTFRDFSQRMEQLWQGINALFRW